MECKILLFAQLAEIIGKKEIILKIQPENTAKELVEKIVQMFPKIKFLQKSLIVAVDTEQIPLDHKIGVVKEEIAIFPPVSGG